MRIYIACLASYNAGILFGEWIDASDDVDAMQSAIADMLRRSPCPNVVRATYHCEDCGESRIVTHSFGEPFAPSIDCEHCGERMPVLGEPYKSAEEYAIHDHEELGNLSEYAGLEEVARRFEIASAADDAGIPAAVLIEAMEDMADEIDDADSFIGERYRGTHESWRDFAQELTEETHDMREIPEWLQGHINWDSVARDFQASGDFNAYRDGEFGPLYFFWSH